MYIYIHIYIYTYIIYIYTYIYKGICITFCGKRKLSMQKQNTTVREHGTIVFSYCRMTVECVL